MNWALYLFGSGFAFFLGTGIVVAGAALLEYCERRWVRRLGSLLAFTGVLLISVSATPLSWWFYGLAGVATVLWVVAEKRQRGWLTARRNVIRSLNAAIWLIAGAIEIPYHLSPRLNITGIPTLYVIGDSLTAGVGGEEVTWPRLLARSHGVRVVDLSSMGATVGSALKQTAGLPKEDGLVLLEIGGNDVLGSTSAVEFERALDRLFAAVCVPGRTVLMFELPLPPFCNQFGRAQRRLAVSYGVVLVPKRVLVSVLAEGGATVDSIHLARSGHERMADVVWTLIRPGDPP